MEVFIIGPALYAGENPFLVISEIHMSVPPYPPGRLLTKYKYLRSEEKHACESQYLELTDLPRLKNSNLFKSL